MYSSSINRKFTELINTQSIDYARVWGTNALGKLTGIMVDKTGKAVQRYGAVSSSDPELVSPQSTADLERISIPDLATYQPLPIRVESPNPPPLGMVFCDSYVLSDGSFQRTQSAASIKDLSDLTRGVNGPGVEFLYDDELAENYFHFEGFRAPVLRDSVTPGLPKVTIQALFQYGKPTQKGAPTERTRTRAPKLKSAI